MRALPVAIAFSAQMLSAGDGLAQMATGPGWTSLNSPVPQLDWRIDLDRSPHMEVRDCGSEAPKLGACELPVNITAEEAATRLAGKDAAWWRDGDQFAVVARRSGGDVELCCAARGKMHDLGNDLWAIRLRVADLDRATIDVLVKPDGDTIGAYRGPLAPAKPEAADPLKGRLEQLSVNSQYLDGPPRQLTIYLPPSYDPASTYPVVYMADGLFRQNDPSVVEPLILSDELPPLIIVEIWPGSTPKDRELRSREYLLGWPNSMAYFLKHESFLLYEVLPAMQKKYHASLDPQQRLIAGFSSGASWAVSMGVRHPDLFPNVLAQSIGWPGAERDLDKPGTTRFFLTAGTMEPDFYKETLRVADIARASGHDVQLVTAVSGHTNTIWREQLLDALKWAFARKPVDAKPSAEK